MNKSIELAFLRNQLAMGRFSNEDSELMSKFKNKMVNSNTPFKELAINAINNCEQDINSGNFKSATQEIQLIHNFTFEDFHDWNSDHFYKIELLSYIELANSSERIKKVIVLIAGLIHKLET